jgi:hypothetical protein
MESLKINKTLSLNNRKGPSWMTGQVVQYVEAGKNKESIFGFAKNTFFIFPRFDIQNKDQVSSRRDLFGYKVDSVVDIFNKLSYSYFLFQSGTVL